MRYDLVIHGGVIVTADADGTVFDNGLICIKDGRLVRLEPLRQGSILPEAVTFIDAGDGIVAPGLINAHSHLPMTLFRGLADDLPLQQWLEAHIFPAEAAHITPHSAKAAALLGCAEMLLSGTTTCCDGYFFEDAVAEAVATSGMRAVLGQGVIDHPAPGVPDPTGNIAAAEAFINRWKEANPCIRPSVFCHSPYTCSAATLQAAKALTRAHGLLFQIHAAETRWELDTIRQSHGVSPIGYLDRLGLLDADTLLVHCVWIDEVDIALIAKRGAAVAHCPESNMKLASGIAPVTRLLRDGVTVALGTDGCASNNDLDHFRTMDLAAKLQKVTDRDPTAAGAASVLAMATRQAAAAIGMGAEIGSLESGKRADLIIVDANRPHMVPLYHPISQLVYTAGGADVRTVVVDGRIVLRDRCLQTMELERIRTAVARLAKAVR
jgi:5-methylthioadenosine/S-adenosylhomocysteine deaminase